MAQREIAKNIDPPDLTDTQKQRLTQLCFIQDPVPEKADLVFLFGAAYSMDRSSQLIRDLAAQGVASKVFVAGGIPPFGDSVQIPQPESELLLQKIRPDDFPDIDFYHEITSTNMRENVIEALKILDFRSYRHIVFASKAHASRRAYLTLRGFVPDAKLSAAPFTVQFPQADTILTKDNWHTFDIGRQKVWGEYLRIKKYGMRGDIAYDEVRAMVEEI